MLSTADEALAAFGSSKGLGQLAFNTDRICSVEFDKSLVVEIEDRPDDATIRLNSPLRPLGDADMDVLLQLLAANFNGSGTGKAALAFNMASGDIVLTQGIEYRHHSAASFIAELDRFLRIAVFWEGHAATLQPDATAEAPAFGDDMINIRL